MKTVYALTFLVILSCLMMGSRVATACICTADYTPVCATNGQTYSNICRLECAGAQLNYSGVCG